MLDYYSPAFSGAGGTAGAGLGGALGRMLEPLDYARQALWNIPSKLSQGDVVGALPGLLGAGATAALGLSGVGLPAAILGGAALGGLSQGGAKMLASDLGSPPARFDAPSGEDLVRALGGSPESTPGWLAGMALNAVGDPLTYAGGIGGAARGAGYGSHLRDVALTRGPRYPGGAEKLAEMFARGEENPLLKERALGILWSPERERILGEISPGSRIAGAGIEATAFQTPEGNITRLAGGPGTRDVTTSRFAPNTLTSVAPQAAPATPAMVAPVRDLPIGSYRVQHSPFLDMLQEGADESLRGAEWEAAQRALEKSAVGAGYSPWDTHLGNIGKTPTGRYVVSDPGAISPLQGTAVPEPIRQVQGGLIDNALLSLLGSDRAIRRAIPREIAAGLPRQGISVPGAAALTEEELRRRALMGALLTNPAPAVPVPLTRPGLGG